MRSAKAIAIAKEKEQKICRRKAVERDGNTLTNETPDQRALDDTSRRGQASYRQEPAVRELAKPLDFYIDEDETSNDNDDDGNGFLLAEKR